MRLLLLLIFAVDFTAVAAHASEPPGEKTVAPTPPRPHTVKCLPSVNVWVEIDDRDLPGHEHTRIESKKRVRIHLADSTPSRGDSVVCSYASRGRQLTTSYYVRCLSPRKERGQRHTYQCR